MRQHLLQLAGAAVEQRLNADTSDERGSRTCCGCGQSARLAGRRTKQVQSVFGPLRLERAYYHCAFCGHGCCPRDQRRPVARCAAPRTRVVASGISRPTDIACAIRSSMRKACVLLRGRRNALDRSRLQRYHRSPLCQAEWPLSGLLGTQNGTAGRMTHHFLGVHPPHPSHMRASRCCRGDCRMGRRLLLAGSQLPQRVGTLAAVRIKSRRIVGILSNSADLSRK